MAKGVKKEVSEPTKEKEVFTPYRKINDLIEDFQSKVNPSERILVCIEHLKAIQTELEREAIDAEVVDHEVVDSEIVE